VFSTPQPGTQPLYSCYSEAEKSHFAANSEDCDHAGKRETLLGYVLKASTPSSASIEGTHQIVSQATGLCFNIRGNTNNSGEAIIPWPCGGFTNMQFNFVDQGSGSYSIHTVNGTQDLCLNISTGASSPGDGKKYGGPGNLIQWSCRGLSDNELFRLVDLGGGGQQIRVKNSGLCLEDPGSGGTIRQNVCSSSPNQAFILTE
jgi:Ricin-type beta-trefoil lectin domain